MAEDSEEKPSPDIAPKGDGVSLENDQVKTSGMWGSSSKFVLGRLCFRDVSASVDSM